MSRSDLQGGASLGLGIATGHRLEHDPVIYFIEHHSTKCPAQHLYPTI